MSQSLTGLVVYDTHHFYDTNDDRNSKAVFMDEARKYGEKTGLLECVLSSEMILGNDRDGIIIKYRDRIVKQNGEKPDYCMYRGTDWRIPFFIEQCQIPCFPSSEVVRLASDKALAQAWMSSHGIPTPVTAYTSSPSFPIGDDDFPFILKSCNGHSGSEVYRVSNIISYENKLASIWPDNSIRQEVMPSGNDLRITLLGDHIDKTVIRRPTEGEFRSHAAYGGQREGYVPSDENLGIIRRAISALPANSGFVACDFLFDEDDKLVFCELNSCPGYVVYDMNGGTLLQRYIDYIERKLIEDTRKDIL